MNFFRNMFQSLHSPLFYQRIFLSGQGIGLKYLLQLLVFCWFIVALVLTVMVIQARKKPDESPLLLPAQILRKVSPQFPLITIIKGKAKMEGDQPFTIFDPATGLPLMIIDTTGKINSLEKSQAQLLMTHSTLRMRYDGEDITYEFPEELTTTVDGAKLEQWADLMERLMPYAPFIMLPFNVIITLLGLAGRWLLMAGIAFVALRATFPDMPFSSFLRIAAHAFTFSIILKMLMIATGFQPFGSPEYAMLGATLLYLFFAVSSVLRLKK